MVYNHIAVWNSEDVAYCSKVASVAFTTFPSPVVVYVTAKLVETNQVYTAATFKVELFAPLVENVVERISTVVLGAA